MPPRFLLLSLFLAPAYSCDRSLPSTSPQGFNASLTSSNNAWYVHPDGARTNDGSPSFPWDLSYALEEGAGGLIAAGDTIYLLGGTYSGHFTAALSGNSISERITFRNFPGDRAILDDPIVGCPGGDDSPAHIKVEGSWLVFQGLEIINTNPTRETMEACHGFRPQPIYNKGK
jgi:hypothetical protein